MTNKSAGSGIKIAATTIVWAFSTGMLGICIPLVSRTESGIALPLAVILGATTSTVVIWLSSSLDRLKSPPTAD